MWENTPATAPKAAPAAKLNVLITPVSVIDIFGPIKFMETSQIHLYKSNKEILSRKGRSKQPLRAMLQKPEGETFMAKNDQVHIIDHPLVQHKLTIMRDKKTSTK